MSVILEAKHISKNFGLTQALKDVSVTIDEGEVIGLIGENGSGKSTLSSIISGVYPQSEGELTLDGKPYKPADTLDAQNHGISMIAQEMGTLPGIKVADNLFIGKEQLFTKHDSIDGIAITLLGIEYCSEPIKSAGREGQVKIAFCDLSENCQGSLDNGETVCAIGGQYADAVFPFVLIYNALEGNALDKVEVPVNFIVCKSGQEFSDYMTYLHNDGVYAWTTDEVDQLIKSKNKNASSDELLEMGKNYSIEDTIARHGK